MNYFLRCSMALVASVAALGALAQQPAPPDTDESPFDWE